MLTAVMLVMLPTAATLYNKLSMMSWWPSAGRGREAVRPEGGGLMMKYTTTASTANAKTVVQRKQNRRLMCSRAVFLVDLSAEGGSLWMSLRRFPSKGAQGWECAEARFSSAG